MIVKVQLPLASDAETAPALLYNKDRSVLMHVMPSRGLLSKMKGRPKVFFNADLVGDSIELGDETKPQDW